MNRFEAMLRALLIPGAISLLWASMVAASPPIAGRITSSSSATWACPLEDWNTGRDDRCDQLANGTPVKIHERGVNPEYRHGPFALVEYDKDGTSRKQYVINSVVTPLAQGDPSEREMAARVHDNWAASIRAGGSFQVCPTLTHGSEEQIDTGLLAIIDQEMADVPAHFIVRSAISPREFMAKFFADPLNAMRAACSTNQEFDAGVAFGKGLLMYRVVAAQGSNAVDP